MTPAAPQMPALLAALWRSSSASSSHCTCAELSGAREARPSRDAHRDPGEKHIKLSSFASKWHGNMQDKYTNAKQPRTIRKLFVQMMKLPYILQLIDLVEAKCHFICPPVPLFNLHIPPTTKSYISK